MKKYLLFVTCLGLVLMVGLSGFIKAIKPGMPSNKKSYQASSPAQPELNRKLFALEFEKKFTPPATEKVDLASQTQILQNISQLPLMFEKNMGQCQKEILYRASTPQTKVAFRKNGITFFSMKELEEHDEDDDEEEDGGEEEEYQTMVWNLNFKGMNTTTQIIAEGEVAGTTNYLLGNDPSKWIKNAPESRLINYKGIYDNIDLHYYGLEGSRLEYDYIVKSGGNMENIKMELEGAGELQINDKGELIITTPWGKVAEAKPFSYQMINGVKKEIEVRYKILSDAAFGFEAYGAYNTNYDLIIDPKQLIWTTYLKATGQTHYTQDIDIDGSKNSYIVGWTINLFDIKSGVQTVYGGGNLDGFISKVNRFGTGLVYSSYLGGSGEDRALSVSVNNLGNAFITGFTESANFPLSNAAFSTIKGGQDTFISAMNLAGNGFTYSTYIGNGSTNDFGRCIVVNGSDEVYVTGLAQSHGTPFPTTANVVRSDAAANGSQDAFVVKLTSSGALAICTLLGGSTRDDGFGIFVSSSGEIYVTGMTQSTDFPAPGAFNNTINGGFDAFVTKLNAGATTIIYSIYLGGTGNDEGRAIVVRNDEAYIAGVATTGFDVTTGAYQTTFANGSFDSFATKLNAAGNALMYSTYLGGTDTETTNDYRGNDIEVNNNGEAYVAGITSSPDFPMTSTNGGFDQTYGGGGYDDGFISLLAADGKSVKCATYIGGDKDDYKRLSITLDLSSSLQDTLYGSITTHSYSSFNTPVPGTFPVTQTQGTVYSNKHISAEDEPTIFKMASCTVPPLPVSLISFTGSNKGDHNLLEWATATEKNNDYFSIERSSDGINFLSIGLVDGAGSSNNILNYSYSDPKEGEDITYYRLKQTDFNGQFNYSNIVAINAANTSKALELIISSPVTDQLNYKICCLHKGNAQVEVIDLSGRVVISSNVQVNEGYNKLILDTKTLAEGLYILKFTADNGTVKVKFVK